MIQKPTNRLLPAIILSISILGCGKLPEVSPTAPPSTDTPATEEVRSEKTRVTVPLATDSELTDLVRGNNDFAFNLYQKLREEESGNLFYSPYSISLALAMTYAGARAKPNARYQTPYTSSYPRTSCTQRSTPSISNSPLAAKGAVGRMARGFD